MAISRIVYHLFLLIVVLSTSVAHADYPLSTDLPAITPDNAARFTELARIDGTLQGQLAWSGDLLAVGTTAGVQLFDTAQPDEPPMTIAGDVNVAFNEAGDTALCPIHKRRKHLWDCAITLHNFHAISPERWRFDSPLFAYNENDYRLISS